VHCRAQVGQLPVVGRSRSIGRQSVLSGVTRTRNGVRPAGSGWCARALFRGEGRHRLSCLEHMPHEEPTPAQTCQESGLS
jgi:hypothetical protein